MTLDAEPRGNNLEMEAPNQPENSGVATGCPTASQTTLKEERRVKEITFKRK